jgi:hypothetical protein
MAKTPLRAFKGIWIPKRLWITEELSWMQKCLLAEIHSLDDEDSGEGCYASNEYLARLFQSTPESIRVMISKLRKAGWIGDRKPMFEGDSERRLRVTFPKQIVTAESENRNSRSAPIKQERKGEISNSEELRLEVVKEKNLKEDQEQEEKKTQAKEIVEAWNEVDGLAAVRSLGATRKKALAARLKDPAWRADWREALERIPECAFLMGESEGADRDWKADFDWFLKPESVARILEGKYDDRTPKRANPTHHDVPLNYGTASKPKPPKTPEEKLKMQEQFRKMRLDVLGAVNGAEARP